LIAKYKNESFEFFKYNNSKGERINTVFVFESQADYLDKYLSYYQDLPNLTEVIVFASDGTFKISRNGMEYFIRHSHQDVFTDKEGNTRGVSLEVSKIVRNNLIKRFNDLMTATDFDQIKQIVTESKTKGFGELSIYDTSLRIAKFKNIEPDKVYLHAGARKGYEVLERKGYIPIGATKKNYLTIEELPFEFQKNLKTYEAENVGCLYKAQFEQLPNKK
ncbi:hypothetical protein, partial [Pontibacter rugosus]